MSDSDEYEKIDESSINIESDKESNNSPDAFENPDTPITEMEAVSFGDDQMEENGGIESENVVAADDEQSESESSDSYIYYTDEELYESEQFQPVSSPGHEKAVQITRKKMKKLRITTPDIIRIEGSETNAEDAQSKLDKLKGIRQDLIKTFAETKQLKILASLVYINDKIIRMQGYDDIETLKPEPKPCSSKNIQYMDCPVELLGSEAIEIIDEMMAFGKVVKEGDHRVKFNESHQKLLEMFMKKCEIENPFIEEHKMKRYGRMLYELVDRMSEAPQQLLACPFGKYISSELREKIVQAQQQSSMEYCAPSSPTSPEQSFQPELPPQDAALQHPQLQTALAVFKAASEEYTSLLQEKHKAYAEDPRDTQQHEHLRNLCLEAEKQCEKAREEYQKLCSNISTSSKLSVVEGPSCSIPPKTITLFHLNRGIDTIKLAEAEEANDNIPEAIKLYSKAVDDFLVAIKDELIDPQAKENVRRRVQKYVVKYEKLKDYLLNHTSYETVVEPEKHIFNSETSARSTNVGSYPTAVTVSSSSTTAPSSSRQNNADRLNELLATKRTRKAQCFNEIKQYDLYLLLSRQLTNPTPAQQDFLEALKNDKYGNETIVLHDFKLLEHPNVGNTNLIMREARAECAILLAEKGPAVLADPVDIDLRNDLISSCSEAYEKYMDAVEKYKQAVEVAINEDKETASWMTKIYNRKPLGDISKEFKCEKGGKKASGSETAERLHNWTKQLLEAEAAKLVKKSSEAIKIADIADAVFEEMDFNESDESSLSESDGTSSPEPEQDQSTCSNSNNATTREFDPLKILEESNQARNKKLADELPAFAVTLNIDEKVASSYRKLKFVERMAESMKTNIGRFNEQDINEIGISYLDMYEKILTKMSAATEEYKKCYEESKGMKAGTMPYVQFYLEKERLDHQLYKLENEDGKAQILRKKLAAHTTERPADEIIRKIENLRKGINQYSFGQGQKSDQKVSYGDLMKAYNTMLALQEEILKLNVQTDPNSDTSTLEHYQKIYASAEKARKNYMILYQSYNASNNGEQPKLTKSKIVIIHDRISELKDMIESCKDASTISGNDKKVLQALIEMLNEEKNLRQWELAIAEDKNGKVLQQLYQKKFEESQLQLKLKTTEFEVLRDKSKNVEGEKRNYGLAAKAMLSEYAPKPISTGPLSITKSTSATHYADHLKNVQEERERDAQKADKTGPIYQCNKCQNHLANKKDLLSHLIDSNGPAYLFSKVENVKRGDIGETKTSSGKYLFRDINCCGCDEELGWIYEFAFKEEQKFKEGKIVLRKCLVTIADNVQDLSSDIPWSNPSNIQCLLDNMVINVGSDEIEKAYAESTAALNNMDVDKSGDNFGDIEKSKSRWSSSTSSAERQRRLTQMKEEMERMQEARKSKNEIFKAQTGKQTAAEDMRGVLRRVGFASAETSTKPNVYPEQASSDTSCKSDVNSKPSSPKKARPSTHTAIIEALEEELAEVKANLKDTENSRKTLIEMNDLLRAQKEDFEAKYLSLIDHADYMAKEAKKLSKDFNDREQKNMEEFEKVYKRKDATIARLQTELAQAKDELAKAPNKLKESLESCKLEEAKKDDDKKDDPNLATELAKAQQQIKYYQKLAADQAEALKKFELAASLEKQLAKANDKVEKVEKALRKREALDSVSNDLVLKKFRDSSDDDDDQFPVL